jgi:hypothetical protein
MADTPTGETVTQGDSQTPVTPPAAPVANADTAETERLRKEKEQADLRIRQLENEAAARKKAEDEAEAKRLAENEEFRTLYEQTSARLKEIEDTQAAQDRQRELETATGEVLKDYPEAVQSLAKTAGLTLSDDSEASKAILKEKLDAFKAQVGGGKAPVSPNNPAAPATDVVSRQELVQRAHPGAESPMAVASAKGDDSVTMKYISELPAIQRMREIAKGGM